MCVHEDESCVLTAGKDRLIRAWRVRRTVSKIVRGNVYMDGVKQEDIFVEGKKKDTIHLVEDRLEW